MVWEGADHETIQSHSGCSDDSDEGSEGSFEKEAGYLTGERVRARHPVVERIERVMDEEIPIPPLEPAPEAGGNLQRPSRLCQHGSER